MITKGLMSSNSCEWATPQTFFDKYNTQMDFTLDVCATIENAKCINFFTKEQNGLVQPWNGRVWCNPPYGKEITKWIDKALNERVFCEWIYMLLPSRTDTKWFHKLMNSGCWIEFIKGRLKFNDGKQSAPFPSIIVIIKGYNLKRI